VETSNLTTRNDAKRRETTCGYAKGVDGVNTPLQPHRYSPRASDRHLAGEPATALAPVPGQPLTVRRLPRIARVDDCDVHDRENAILANVIGCVHEAGAG
jgi:hypothetical protein